MVYCKDSTALQRAPLCNRRAYASRSLLCSGQPVILHRAYCWPLQTGCHPACNSRLVPQAVLQCIGFFPVHNIVLLHQLLLSCNELRVASKRLICAVNVQHALKCPACSALCAYPFVQLFLLALCACLYHLSMCLQQQLCNRLCTCSSLTLFFGHLLHCQASRELCICCRIDLAEVSAASCCMTEAWPVKVSRV